MTRVTLAVLFVSAAACAQQSEPEESRIERPEPPAIGAPAPERQPNWVDEAARPAGAAIPGQSTDRTFSPSAPEVRQYIAQLTNTTLTPGALPDAAQMLCAEDRSRVADQIKRLDLADHDQLIRRFREQWKTRYGEEFDLQRQGSVVADYFVLGGLRSPEEAIIAAHQSPGRSANGQSQNARPQEHPQDQQRAATMVVPPNPDQKQPAMILMLLNETPTGADWRLNTPNTLNAEKLRQNLDERLSRFLDGQSQWPADPREAYRLIGYHVLATFNDQPADRPRQQTPHPEPSRTENPSLDT